MKKQIKFYEKNIIVKMICTQIPRTDHESFEGIQIIKKTSSLINSSKLFLIAKLYIKQSLMYRLKKFNRE